MVVCDERHGRYHHPQPFKRLMGRRDILIGTGAAIFAVTIWAAWIVGTRHAVTGTLPPESVGLLRMAVPALLFAPIWLRVGVAPRDRRGLLALCVLGAGAPFFIVVATGMKFAPAADIGPLLPGTMPLFAALLAVMVDRERIGGMRLIGYGLIVAGILAIAGRGMFDFSSGAWRGHVLVLLGAFLWAIYTIAFRRSRLGAIEAAALIGFWSTLLLLPFGTLPLAEAWRAGHGWEIAAQAIIQGVFSGILGLVGYGVAVARLGASRAAAFAALAPGMAALIAVPVLGEVPDTAAVVGIVATSVGVALASGAVGARRSIPA
jgi:drug/metabolite transporter (DMT)-like permease